MKKIIDANYFQEPALEKYLSADRHNKVVFIDYACMEAYKGNALKNIYKSISIVSKYPNQVIVLKATSTIVRMKLSSKGQQKRFEDPSQTREFNIFCENVKRAKEGNIQLTEQIMLKSQQAMKHFMSLKKDANQLIRGIAELGKTFQNKDLKNLREKGTLSDELITRVRNDILVMTALLYQKQPNFHGYPPAASLRNSYLFRFAICSHLLALRWVADGGANNAKPAKLLNDGIDANYAAYATFFDGLLTKDSKMKNIYLDASFLLREVFN